MNHQQKNAISLFNIEVTTELYKILVWEITFMFYKHWKIKIRWHIFATRSTSSYSQIIVAKIACCCSAACLTHEQGPLQNQVIVRVSHLSALCWQASRAAKMYHHNYLKLAQSCWKESSCSLFLCPALGQVFIQLDSEPCCRILSIQSGKL